MLKILILKMLYFQLVVQLFQPDHQFVDLLVSADFLGGAHSRRRQLHH